MKFKLTKRPQFWLLPALLIATSSVAAVREKAETASITSNESETSLCERARGAAQHIPATCSWRDETGVPFGESVDTYCSCSQLPEALDSTDRTCVATKRWKCNYNEDRS